MRGTDAANVTKHLYLARLGEDDYAKIRNIAGWIDAHPEKREMLKYLRSNTR